MITTRWHTEGRRQPVLIGKDASGRRIPGGPYVVWQLAAIPLFPTLWHFRAAWAGGHSSFGTLVLTLAVTASVFIAIGRVDFAGRNPLLVLAGASAALLVAHSAARGRLGGVALRPAPGLCPRRGPAATALHSRTPTSPPERRRAVAEPAEAVGRGLDGSVQRTAIRPAQPAIRPVTTHAEPVEQPEPPTDSATTTTDTSPIRAAASVPSSARLSPLESFLQAAGKV